jgi:hypothetical protein
VRAILDDTQIAPPSNPGASPSDTRALTGVVGGQAAPGPRVGRPPPGLPPPGPCHRRVSSTGRFRRPVLTEPTALPAATLDPLAAGLDHELWRSPAIAGDEAVEATSAGDGMASRHASRRHPSFSCWTTPGRSVDKAPSSAVSIASFQIGPGMQPPQAELIRSPP